MKIFNVAVASTAVLVLAACGTTGTSTPGTPGGTTTVTYATPEAAASAYAAGSPTIYTPDATVDAALTSPSGIVGFGVTSTAGGAPVTAASNSTNQYTLGRGRLTNSGDTLEITVGGQTYSLPFAGSHEDELYFGNHPDFGGGTQGETGGIFHFPTYDGDSYVSILAHAKNGRWEFNEQEHHPDGGYWRLVAQDDYSVLVAGLLTPEGQLPATTADYYGGLFVVSHTEALANAGGFFEFEVDFVTGKIVGTAGTETAPGQGLIGSNISGSLNKDNRATFTGTFTPMFAESLNGTFMGGFFGPNAEQTAGTGSVQVGGHDAGVFFAGEKFHR